MTKLRSTGGRPIWPPHCFSTLAADLHWHARAAEPAPARIQGTFIQLTSQHGAWKPENWADLFGQFRQMGLSQVIVQWTLYDETAFFAGTRHRAVGAPPLETILRLADEHRLDVLVGLAHDPGFWLKIRRDPILVEVYLRRLRLRSVAVAAELAPLVPASPLVSGLVHPRGDRRWKLERR